MVAKMKGKLARGKRSLKRRWLIWIHILVVDVISTNAVEADESIRRPTAQGEGSSTEN
jgi:hypothetical protein